MLLHVQAYFRKGEEFSNPNSVGSKAANGMALIAMTTYLPAVLLLNTSKQFSNQRPFLGTTRIRIGHDDDPRTRMRKCSQLTLEANSPTVRQKSLIYTLPPNENTQTSPLCTSLWRHHLFDQIWRDLQLTCSCK